MRLLLLISLFILFNKFTSADDNILSGADIDYGVATAATAYGNCGIKVWIFRGELMEHNPMAMENARNSQQGAPR